MQNTITVRLFRALIFYALMFLIVLIGMSLLVYLYLGISFTFNDLVRIGNPAYALFITSLMFTLSWAFIEFRIEKRRRLIKRKPAWKILVIHIVVLAAIYGAAVFFGNHPKMVLLSLVFFTAFVGCSRFMTIPNILVRIHIVNYSCPVRWRLL